MLLNVIVVDENVVFEWIVVFCVCLFIEKMKFKWFWLELIL